MASFTYEQAYEALRLSVEANDHKSASEIGSYIQSNFPDRIGKDTQTPDPALVQPKVEMTPRELKDREFYRSQNPNMPEEEFNKRWEGTVAGRREGQKVLSGLEHGIVQGTQAVVLDVGGMLAGGADHAFRLGARVTGGGITEGKTLSRQASDYLYEKAEEVRGPTQENLQGWEDLKNDFTPGKLIRFGVERGFMSVPYMALVMASAPAYLVANAGKILDERLEATGKAEPDAEDYAWAMGAAGLSTVLEKVGAKLIVGPTAKTGAGRIAQAAIGEPATEFGQEFVEYAGSTARTPQGFDIATAVDRGMAGAAGGLGAGVMFGGANEITGDGSVSAETAAKNGPQDLFTHPKYAEDRRRVADRIFKAVDGDYSRLSLLDESDNRSARAAADATLAQLRAEEEQLHREMSEYAKTTDDPREAMLVLDTIKKVTHKQSAAVPRSYLEALKTHFGDTADVQRLTSIANQIGLTEQFLRPGGTRSGLSRITRYADVTEKNSGLTKGLQILHGITSRSGSYALGGGIVLNKLAIGFDKALNQRSRVKRFYDDAIKNTPAPKDIEGTSARDLTAAAKAAAIAARQATAAAEAKKKLLARHNAKPVKFGPWSNVTLPGGKKAAYNPTVTAEARRLSKAAEARKTAEETTAKQRADNALRRVTLKQMFDTNSIPESDYYEPYQLWKKYTGMGPADIRNALAELAADPESGVLDTDALSFSENIHDLKEDHRYMDLQELVRQRYNGEYGNQAEERKAMEEAKKTQQEAKTDSTIKIALAKATAKTPRGANPTKSTKRGVNKPYEGQRRYNLLLDAIDADPNLTEVERAALYELADTINSPEFTKEDRKEIVEESMPSIIGKSKAKRVKAALWIARFGGLVSIANDYPIYRDAVKEPAELPPAPPTPSQVDADKKHRKRSKKPKSTDPVSTTAPVETPTVVAPQTVPDTTVEPSVERDYVAELNEAKTPAPASVPVDPKDGPKERLIKKLANSAREKLAKKQANKGHGHNPTLAEKLALVFESFDVAKNLVRARGGELNSYLNNLAGKGTPDAEVELMLLTNPGRNTQNQLTENYAAVAGISIELAVQVVNNALASLEAQGKIIRVIPKNNSAIKQDGTFVKTTDGKVVTAINVDPVRGSDFESMMEVAKARVMVEKLPDVSHAPPPFTPLSLKQGWFKAFKGIPDIKVTEAHTPLLNFVNGLRSMPVKVDNRIMDIIEKAVLEGDPKRLGLLAEQLQKTVERGKDISNLTASAQILYQLRMNQGSPLFFQEWFAGENGRVYAKNGSATTQGGDLMKGLFRSPVRIPPGTRRGLNFMFHSFGNILGFDKEAPSDRRAAIFKQDTISQLIDFANDPFKRDSMVVRRTGKPTRLGKIVGGSEGFFQTLSVAMEIRDMAAWAATRHPQHGVKASFDANGKLVGVNGTPSMFVNLLSNPEVQEDMAQNYTTDMFVQLDANNNSFQLVGLLTGDTAMLQNTGLVPHGRDPDTSKGADVYVEPAMAAAKAVAREGDNPFGDILNMSDAVKRIRKIFKRPISTYVYASTSQSRNEAFMGELISMAKADGFVDDKGAAVVFGLEGTKEGLINIPKAIHEALAAGEPVTMMNPKYDSEGDIVEYREISRRIIPDGDKWKIETTKGEGKTDTGKMKFDTKEEAIVEAYERDFKGRLNRELVREIETRFPKVREFMRFTGAVEKIMKDRTKLAQDRAMMEGKTPPKPKGIKVPLPDGVVLEYKFKESSVFEPHSVKLADRLVERMGIRTDITGAKGRGLAAFIAHSHDAFVMRETARQIPELSGFNPIHDSFGFHPSQAEAGQAKVLEIMQALGSQNYNIFENILKANGISIEEYLNATGGDQIIERQGTPSYPADQIPTALS